MNYFNTMISMQLKMALSFLILTTKNIDALDEINACQNKYLLLGSSYNEAKVIDVSLGLTVYLNCDFW